MQIAYNKKLGSGQLLQNKGKKESDTTVSFSVAESNGDYGIHSQQTIQRLQELLKEQVERLQNAVRRTEAVQVKRFAKYLNQKEVIAYLGHEKIFWILVDEYGLKPIRQEHRCNIYCSKQLEEKCTMFEHNIAP
jgi:ribosomal protein S25